MAAVASEPESEWLWLRKQHPYECPGKVAYFPLKFGILLVASSHGNSPQQPRGAFEYT